MNRKNAFIASIAMTIILAAAAYAEVKTDYDRAANFTRYKTFSWEKVETSDPLWVSRIKNSVSAALAAKGWTLVDSGGDVAVLAMEVTKEHQTLNTYYDQFGGGWRWGGGFGDATTTTETYKVGTLVVDLFDASTKGLIWRGSASDTLSSKSDKNIKALDKSVQQLFEHFPPGAPK
jgi:hypothetical protein